MCLISDSASQDFSQLAGNQQVNESRAKNGYRMRAWTVNENYICISPSFVCKRRFPFRPSRDRSTAASLSLFEAFPVTSATPRMPSERLYSTRPRRSDFVAISDCQNSNPEAQASRDYFRTQSPTDVAGNDTAAP